TTRKYGGTGLGLTIAKQLVELMHGEIGAESAEDAGSRFWFTARFGKSSTANAPLPAPSALKGRRALYAGAEGTQRESLLLQLSAWEMETTVADDGAAAVKALEADPAFDLLIIDSRLDGTDGRALAQAIRGGTVASKTPIILLVPLAEYRVTDDGFHRLTKPVRHGQLYARLCAALGLDEAPAEVAHPAARASLAPQANSTDPRVVSLSEGVATDWRAKERSKDFRLLLVEDNQTNQQVAVSTLARLGYKVESVANGREAVAALRRSVYDLVFMDCHMPEMDGFEATTEIRRTESATRRTPIIAMTASALPEDRARCLAVGMDDYLTKPLRRHELDAILNRWLHEIPRPVESIVEERSALTLPEAGYLEPEALDNLRSLGGGNQSFLCELIDLFLLESIQRLAEMREALTNGNFKAISHLAHTQRGACLNFGAREMARLCATLENISDSAKKAEPDEIRELVALIESEFFQVRRALDLERALQAPEI
ncbi:MAG TPA: response regulator, partial [Pyrinomonadaceae bacterium]|nr:response regulator [Pyrinomonadaceae bacterium]